MRKQYHSRQTEKGRYIWDVHRLVALSSEFEVIEVPLDKIRELDENFWFQDANVPTCRAIALHAKLIEETDLAYPIILSENGRVMDGMHRVAKAFLQGHASVRAVQFDSDPPPDYIDVDLDSLPYD